MALACFAARRLAPAATATAVASRSAARRLPLLCRATASRAVKHAQPEVYHFEQAARAAPIFPELLQPGRRAVLLAVDPDLCGAVAAVSWINPPAPAGNEVAMAGCHDMPGSHNGISSSDSCAVRQQPHRVAHLPPPDQLAVELHDMPLEIWQYGTRNKKHPDAAGLIAILGRYADMAGNSPAFGLQPNSYASSADVGSDSSDCGTSKRRRARRKKDDSSSSSIAELGHAVQEASHLSNGSSSSGGTDGQVVLAGSTGEVPAEAPVVRAVVEYSLPAQISGKFAWYGIGFSVGMLNGLLAAQHIPYHRVHASTWKAAMGLRRQGKDGSIALARHLMPTAAHFLMRKKDHGRAEALLLAAWALGIRMQSIANGEAVADLEDQEDSEGEAVLGGSEEEAEC